MLSGLYVVVARLSALALDGVPGLLGTGEDGAKLSSCVAADCGVAVLIEGRGLLGGVCRSVCDRDSRVGEFGPGSEPAEDQAVMKLRTLGLGMFAGIPGCRTRGCQCNLLEWWWLLGSCGCLGKSEWQVLEGGGSDWQRLGRRRGIQRVSEDGRRQRPVDGNVPIKTGK